MRSTTKEIRNAVELRPSAEFRSPCAERQVRVRLRNRSRATTRRSLAITVSTGCPSRSQICPKDGWLSLEKSTDRRNRSVRRAVPAVRVRSFSSAQPREDCLSLFSEGLADSMPTTPICDEDCAARLDSIETVTTSSGLQFKDLVVGRGPKPPTGFLARHPTR